METVTVTPVLEDVFDSLDRQQAAIKDLVLAGSVPGQLLSALQVGAEFQALQTRALDLNDFLTSIAASLPLLREYIVALASGEDGALDDATNLVHDLELAFAADPATNGVEVPVAAH